MKVKTEHAEITMSDIAFSLVEDGYPWYTMELINDLAENLMHNEGEALKFIQDGIEVCKLSDKAKAFIKLLYEQSITND